VPRGSLDGARSLNPVREVSLIHEEKWLSFRIDDILPSKTLEYFISTQHWLDAFTPPLEKHLDSLVSILNSIITKQAGVAAELRLKPHPFEEDAPEQPAPVAPPSKTITVRVPTRKVLLIVLGLK
jgi:hypothetical protein